MKHMKKFIPGALILIALFLFAAWLESYNEVSQGVIASPKDATYSIDGKPVVLGSEGTRYFGNEAISDLDGDGRPDVAFLFTQDQGGSGTFYYVAVALGSAHGYVGTNAILLGDRIAPQTTMIQDGDLIVNYADRKQGEPMTTQPSVGVSSYFKIVDGKLVLEGSR